MKTAKRRVADTLTAPLSYFPTILPRPSPIKFLDLPHLRLSPILQHYPRLLPPPSILPTLCQLPTTTLPMASITPQAPQTTAPVKISAPPEQTPLVPSLASPAAMALNASVRSHLRPLTESDRPARLQDLSVHIGVSTYCFMSCFANRFIPMRFLHTSRTTSWLSPIRKFFSALSPQ